MKQTVDFIETKCYSLLRKGVKLMRTYLVELREERGLSQQDVSKTLNISSQYYSMIERGERQSKMEITLAVQLSNIFNVTLQKFIDMEQTYQNTKAVG